MFKYFIRFLLCLFGVRLGEKTSRMNLFRRLREGGFSLPHLFLRRIVNRFLSLRDVSDLFLCTVPQVRLGRAFPEYIVSSSYVTGALQGYFNEVVSSCRFLAARFFMEYLSGVTRNKLYKDVSDVVFPVSIYRALYSEGPGQDVLERVKRILVPLIVKTFSL